MGLKIKVETIHHGHHRYPTVGDWWHTPTGEWEIRVSQLANWKYEFLVAFHEMIEAALCRDRGISEAEVTQYDKSFEFDRAPDDASEPGDQITAPYHWQHQIATMFERVMARQLGVNWDEYERTINEL
jgi:hypothetical protein